MTSSSTKTQRKSRRSSGAEWRLLAQSSPAGLALATDPRFCYPPHLQALDEALVGCFRGDIRRLLVTMPPRHGKSELVSWRLPAWWLGMRPDAAIILASYGSDFASSWGRRARDLLAEHGPSVFGVAVDDTSAARDRWNVANRRGGMLTAGVGAGLTGAGADLLVIDDPVKSAEEAMSATYRDRAWDWYRSVAYTRLHPGAPVILVMTRWHEDDLAGRLLAQEADGWHVLSFPALAEAGDALGRPEEAALWPERYDAEALDGMRCTVGSRVWTSLYQQRPSPDEGGEFHRSWWRYYDPASPPQFQEIVQSWDMAVKDTDTGSFVVGQVWGRDLAAKYLLFQVRKRLSFSETVQEVRHTSAWVEANFPSHASHAVLIEDAANGPAVIDTLRREIPGIVPVSPDQSKVARARAVSPTVEAGNVCLPGPTADTSPLWVQELVEECAQFPFGAHDDQVDALSQALRRLDRRGHGGRRHVRTGGTVRDVRSRL